MPPTDARPAPAPWRKTPPQGLRLRRFKRAAAVARPVAPARPRGLRRTTPR